MGALTETARAKVNLYLHVVGRRPDGYHLLDSLAVFPAASDVLYGSPSHAGLELTVSGPFAAALAGEGDNLVLRAARALAESAGRVPRLSLELQKRLPVASGIGGGSADAAAALRLLARLWNIDIPPDLPARLGADVPVCLRSRPARMGGIGERLAAVPRLPDGGIVLVNPGLPVATADVFRARTGAFSPPPDLPQRWADMPDLAAWLRTCANDLEAPACALCPRISEVLAELSAQPDCLLARMSGSGATCFGLFAGANAAEAAARHMRRQGWWTWGGALDDGDGTGAPGRVGVAERA